VENLRFEWDEAKHLSNRRKHVSFEEATAVFRDPLCVSVQDRIDGGNSAGRLSAWSRGCSFLP